MKVESGRDILALVIDKDTRYTKRLGEGLIEQGFRVVRSFVKEDTEQIVQRDSPDIILIDPKDLGFGVTWLKQLAKTPVIVLSRDASLQAKMAAYRQGADLYLSKVEKSQAISPNEIAARSRAILRRPMEAIQKPPSVLQYDRLIINLISDHETCLVFRDGDPVHMSHLSRRLLWVLGLNVGELMSQEELIVKYKGPEYLTAYEVGAKQQLRVDISRLRFGLGPHRNIVQTFTNRGYYLIPPSENYPAFEEKVLFDQVD